ncbi:LppP/LprE family lipoprotein [Nocardia halotolerans]|uniref:LppP/LprE family lipoprotein n=1 Tax=Nocardia halotolerans TaxID=1755878 RepID=A0ABV8VID6_9NOCA
MKNSVRMGALIAVAAGLVAGCNTDELPGPGATTTVDTSATAAPTSVRAPMEQPGPPATGQPPATRPPAATPAPGEPPGTASPTAAPAPADDISGPGRCIDPASSGVQNAVARLGAGWVAVNGSEDLPGSCSELLWMRAVGGNSAGAPIHIMFFHDGKYLGTGTSEPYAFTTVAGSDGVSVTVEYRWLAGDEPFAAPQGGPATITYSWTGTSVVMSGPLPPEVTRPHR